MGARNRAFQKQRNGWSQSPRRGNNFANHDTTITSQNAVAFSLLDEARQTSHHDNSLWNSNIQLRKKPVTFVSSGSHDPLIPLQTQTEDAKDSPDIARTPEETVPEETSSEEAAPVETTPEEAIPEEILPVETIHEETIHEETTPEETTPEEITPEEITPEETPLEETPLEETPLEETPLEETPLEEIVYKETVPEETINEHPAFQDASSSDEIIVFRGRNAMKPKTQAPDITLTSMRTEIRAVEKQISVAPRVSPIRPTEDDDDSDGLLWPRKKSDKSRKRRDWRKDTEEEAMLADYIANMRQHGEMIDGLDTEDDSDSTATSDDAEIHPSASLGPNTAEEVDIYSTAEHKPDRSLFDDPNEEPDKDEPPHSSSRERRKGKLPLDDPAGTYMHAFSEVEYLEEEADFDLMDWERPSLRRKKGKAGRLQLLGEDMDSDLEEKLQSAYNNDRQKKAQRKKEREELRAQGLLGKRGQLDLRAKYSKGITMGQVADEVKTFLVGSQEILTLPPMDKRTRKMVHELANKFNIKSKSIGAGEQRRPVLYRTKKTTYKEAAFEQAVMRVKRQYSSQPSKQSRQKSSARHDAGTSYQDGEVIGARAPELGTGNRGRTMLEKMGWSTGTPLGTSDNQGILQPVSQTMKRTRAGLGQE